MNDPQTTDGSVTFNGVSILTDPLSPIPCQFCSQGLISVYHVLGEDCPRLQVPVESNVITFPSAPNWQIVTPPPDEQLNRLWQKLPDGAVVGVTYTKDGWGAFVSGVVRPCTVTGHLSEMTAKEALIDELMQRAVSRCCGGSDG